MKTLVLAWSLIAVVIVTHLGLLAGVLGLLRRAERGRQAVRRARGEPGKVR